jgi:lipoate-protein ligase B
MKFIISDGITPYTISLIDMKVAHENVREGKEESIFVTEHEGILSAGLSFNSTDFLPHCSGKIYISERGGKVTIHNPGQLVVYPIINLRKRSLNISSYVSFLERWMIDVLNDFDIVGQLSEQGRGVWVNKSKIGFIGIKIKSGVTMHGLCLNVCNDLKLFEQIIPCGISGLEVTSIAKILRKNVSRKDVVSSFIRTCRLRTTSF